MEQLSEVSGGGTMLKSLHDLLESYFQRTMLIMQHILLAVRLIGKLEDGTVFAKKGHEGDEPFEFKTDEEQAIDGLDRTVITMKKGEIALARIPPELAFGSAETKHELVVVPPNSTVFYEVELVSFEKVII
jgi:FK506-binding protein 4/5